MLRYAAPFRNFVRGIKTRELIYAEYGEPSKVIQMVERDIGELKSGHVHVKWLGSPVNPADMNQIQGVYPVKPAMPAVGGNEGFGKVVKVADDVKELKLGDHVIPARSGLGVWRSDGYHKPSELFPIDSDLPFEASASFQVNPPTAYRMLHDFVKLNPGDTVIQNGASSAVGRAVIQISSILGIKTVNIVRKRDDMKPIVDDLKSLGANMVIDEEEFRKTFKTFKNIKLALNCVGGKSTMFLASTLSHGGYMVTYGGMSKQPLQIPTGPFIFKDIVLAGFWMSKWYENPANIQERYLMYKQLSQWVKEGKLHHPRFQQRKLEEFSEALESANNFIHKQLFTL